MPRYVLRIWLDDRPGALGSVASRIGSVKGDLVGIEILERGGGRVIDELVVDLPSEDLVDLMVREVQEVDGVDVEDVSFDPNPDRDSRLDPILTAALIVEKEDPLDLVSALIARLSEDFLTEWAVAFDLAEKALVFCIGDSPVEGWLRAYVDGMLTDSKTERNEPADLALAIMHRVSMAIVLGRPERPFRDLERSQLSAIARIGDVKLSSLMSGVKLL